MVATSIQDAKVLISSTKVADRNAGLRSLIQILKHSRGKPSLDSLGSKGYQALCETLFQCMRDERSSLLRSRAKASRTAVLLPLCANALRHLISSGVRTIKTPTVEMIVDTIVELLPGRDGHLIKPLVEDLPKTLRALLEYQPHVEHLSKECWEATVDFCIEALANIFVEPAVEPHSSWSTAVSSRGPTPFESTDGARRDSSSRQKPVAQDLLRAAEDLVHCLQLLVKASNSPVLGKAEVVLRSMVCFLQQKGGRGKAAALAAINSILPRITLHATQLTEQVVQELVPLMKVMWSELLLRDEIMITLIYTEAHIASMLLSPRDDSFSLELEALVEAVYSDYRRRQETTAHQYLEDDHLCFRAFGKARNDTHPLRTTAFSLRSDQARYEGLWATVATISRLSFLLDERNRNLAQNRRDEEESVSKRPRLNQHFQEYLRHVSEPRSNAKRAALQVVAFMAEEGRLDENDLQSLLEKLLPCISDENPAHSSWAMIGLATAASQQASKAEVLSAHWASVWTTAARAVTTLSSSRAACHLMDVLLKLKIVPFSAVSDTVQAMLLSIELGGPALLTEASSALMTTLVRARINENPTHYNMTAERVLNWLFTKWVPSLWSDRSYAALNAHHCNAQDVLRVIHACLDRPFEYVENQYRVLGPVAQARMQTFAYRDLSAYLLLLDDEPCFSLHFADVSSSTSNAPSNYANQLESRVLEFCIAETDKARQGLKALLDQNPQPITPDMLRVCTHVCIAVAAIPTLVNGNHDHHRVSALESAADNIARGFSRLLSKAQFEQYKVDAILESCVENLRNIKTMTRLSQEAFRKDGVLFLANHLSRALEDRKEVKQSFHVQDDDFMENDDVPNSQLTAGGSALDADVPRHDISASTEAGSLHTGCMTYLRLISAVGDMVEGEEDCIPSEFVEYLTLISEVELLRSRQFVQAMLDSPFTLSRADCLKFLERLGDALIDPRARDYKTSEVANGMIVDLLTGIIRTWTLDAADTEASNLHGYVEDLYMYYATGMEKSGVRRSSGLQTRVAMFFHGLLRHHPGFAQNRKVPSVRTSLFDLLSHGEMTVKYHIAERLPEIFEDFVLSEHDKILQDVDSSLPSEDGWLEGISIRLLVLSNLASRWHTLLRQCVYRLFATAGSIVGVAQHARRCVAQVAKSKGMDNSQKLFKLFAPQIVYTWLDRERRIAEMPYSTFGYETLVDLLRDIEPEVVGQAIMRGLLDEVNYLAEQFGVATPELLTRNMSKAAAYTISWDTCRGHGRNKAIPSTMNLLRDLVGKDSYTSLIQKQFPQVLGFIFQTIDQEDRVNKQLAKRAPFVGTAKALSDMESISHSTLDLNIGIEPAFNAYYLIDQLDRLCRRTGDDIIEFWSPSIYTLVVRMLLDRMHPALGSLYARSLIRKIRIVVALAGPVACEGYPLQMTLQSLRPFLTDVQCAEDTVGIMQYLFTQGTSFLRSNLGFVTGIGLSVLISIRVFLGSSQESTTQQSQHTATMNTATRFHTWFTEYLKKYADSLSTNESESSIKAFRLITMAASQVRTEGNSSRGSEESKLLLEILDDVRSGRRLLNNTSREVALDLLCQNFQPAPASRDDVLGSDGQAAAFAPHIWDSCQRNNVGDGYLLWAARVLGRAFSAHGDVKRNTVQSRPWSLQSALSDDHSGRASRAAIVGKVVDIFYSDDRREVSLAENAIRELIARLLTAESSYVKELNDVIPTPIGKALGLPLPTGDDIHSSKETDTVQQCAAPTDKKSPSEWIRDLSISLCREAAGDPVLGALSTLLAGISHMAETLFPYILHLVLLREFDGTRSVHQTMSTASMAWFSQRGQTRAPHMRILVQAILYLRTQPVPREVTRVERDQWLELDYLQASHAATDCGMYRSALLFAETSSGQPKVKSTSRRSSVLVEAPKLPVELQLSIYKNLDEPDSFYGVDRGYGLAAVVDRFDYEGDGVKSLLFRGARLDSQFRRNKALESSDSRGMVKSLIMLNMNSVTHSLLSNEQYKEIGNDVVDGTLHTARKLGQWDIKAPETNNSEASTLFKAFQGLHYSTSAHIARNSLDGQLLATMESLAGKSRSSISTKSCLRTLAALTEADEIISISHPDHLLDAWDRMKSRETWMQAGDFDDVRQILSCRETLFHVLSTNTPLLDSLRVGTGTVRNIETEALVSSSGICRRHGALQESLASVTYLSDLVPECRAVGLDIEAVAQHEVASVLWEQGEVETSIRMRKHLIDHANLDSQDTSISLPVLLAKLGHHIAEARLEKPDSIIREYLEPAIQELKSQVQGPGPGQVFHEFALFCDKQLQNPEAAEDMERIKTVMDRKLQECQEFLNLSANEKSKGMRETYRRNAMRAKNWYNLDRTEYERLRKGREQFLQQCLENYLRSLQASDEYNNDALRVFSLWLEHSDMPLANDAVKRWLHRVPSGKFALLMNQLSSRLQAEESEFQHLLRDLVFRICVDHPYHGMHQIFAIQTKVGNITREDVVRSKDEAAKSRQRAAHAIAEALAKDARSRPIWNVIYRSNQIYHALAMFKDERENKQGREYKLDKYPESRELLHKVPQLRVPPATLQIEVRSDMKYDDLPTIYKWRSTMSIANGLSAPKIITAIGTDGKNYKQLFKSGNDDLRQDAIMEQVFDQVSRLLKNHTATRLRNLGIRTYKVLPLSTRSGLMEFVQDTVPLHLWVMPAHEKYYPRDFKSDKCRKEIANVQGDSLQTRVKVWQKCAENFHPVLRYFLLEHFEDPDEWFERRLAYTRSTAAISILGHVLGLGDRHCHNILLDKKSGEVIHIDLGVSFEAGRVLPVPEVVPFRLTRDLVDAMGYTKTEGVFRRCCEFIMDTLREERESIMTLLNVLRYDPLVNWSVTPTKAKRMQEDQNTNAQNGGRAGTVGPSGTPAPSGITVPVDAEVQESNKKKDEQAGEAGRALSVVEKKLSKTLSTKATVNELIQAATDERNLAVLYAGWASYA